MDVIHMAQTYKCRPSELLNLDGYEAYCFDEACAYIISELQEKKTPRFPEDRKSNPLLQKMMSGAY